MSERFYVENPLISNSNDDLLIEVTGQEATHISRVMRLKIGDHVVVFDGQGAEATTVIKSISKKSVWLRSVEIRQISRESANRVVVGVALPKADRSKRLVEKLTELGVAELYPIISERSSVHPRENTISKLRRSVIEASKQCQRNRLMQINEPVAFANFISFANPQNNRILLDPSGDQSIRKWTPKLNETVWIVIGPEGGFTELETQMAINSGWQLMNLGKRLLRIETAAIFASSWAVRDS